MANNDVLKISGSELADLALAMKKQAKQELQIAAHPSDPYKADKYEREYLDGLYKNLQIKKEAGKDPVDVFKDGIQGEFDLSKGPVLPEFKPMGREIKGVRKGVLSPEENKIKQQLQIGPQANVNYGPPTERDLFLQRFQGKDGTLRNHPEKIRSTILSIGGRMKADASNNIRSLQSSGHQTVLDDNRPGHLKIIKQFKPPKA